MIAPECPSIEIGRRPETEPLESFRFYAEAQAQTTTRHGRTSRDSSSAAEQFSSPSASSEVNSYWWYHTIELPDGTATPGAFDHRPLVPFYGIPNDLSGKRCLDIATCDGFWAFELERRGGDVTAYDLPRISEWDLHGSAKSALRTEGRDREAGSAFDIARSLLGSRVRRIEGSVYDLDPQEVGVFDFVHSGDLLLHLERPLDALRSIRSVTGAEALIVDSFDPEISNYPGKRLVNYVGGSYDAVWWLPGLDTLGQMILDAGFSSVTVHRVYNLPAANEQTGLWRAVFKAIA